MKQTLFALLFGVASVNLIAASCPVVELGASTEEMHQAFRNRPSFEESLFQTVMKVQDRLPSGALIGTALKLAECGRTHEAVAVVRIYEARNEELNPELQAKVAKALGISAAHLTETELSKVIEKEQETPELLLKLGKELLQRGHAEEARRAFKRVIELILFRETSEYEASLPLRFEAENALADMGTQECEEAGEVLNLKHFP